MLFCSTPLVPGKQPWNISNTPTCSLSPWTTSGVGTAITISSQICYDSDCIREAPHLRDEGEDVNELHIRASVNGMKTMDWR